MTTGILKHTLRGLNGWSLLCIKEIDVMKVVEIAHRRRLFCIFDREYPWTLTIEYNEPTESIEPVYTTGGAGFTISVELTQSITKRYQTERQVLTEISQIKRKQAGMIEWQKETADLIMKRMSKSGRTLRRCRKRGTV